MNRKAFLVSFFFAVAAAYTGLAAAAPSSPEEAASSASLTSTILKLDTAFFDSFNHCSEPGQLQKHADYLNPDVEFYHDKGGVTWTRRDYLEKTRQNVCGHFRRVLTPGTVEVFPIKGFGAIEDGHHTFCDIKSGKCFGQAKFLVVWHQTPHGWEITRIFSYGHEAMGGT